LSQAQQLYTNECWKGLFCHIFKSVFQRDLLDLLFHYLGVPPRNISNFYKARGRAFRSNLFAWKRQKGFPCPTEHRSGGRYNPSRGITKSIVTVDLKSTFQNWIILGERDLKTAVY